MPGVADEEPAPFEQTALQVVVELPLGEVRYGSAFGFQPGEKLRVVGLDNLVERRPFWPMSFVCVALRVVGLWHSSALAPTWVDEVERSLAARLSSGRAVDRQPIARGVVGIDGGQYTTPLVHAGIMYVQHPCHGIQALDATRKPAASCGIDGPSRGPANRETTVGATCPTSGVGMWATEAMRQPPVRPGRGAESPSLRVFDPRITSPRPQTWVTQCQTVPQPDHMPLSLSPWTPPQRSVISIEAEGHTSGFQIIEYPPKEISVRVLS